MVIPALSIDKNNRNDSINKKISVAWVPVFLTDFLLFLPKTKWSSQYSDAVTPKSSLSSFRLASKNLGENPPVTDSMAASWDILIVGKLAGLKPGKFP